MSAKEKIDHLVMEIRKLKNRWSRKGNPQNFKKDSSH